MPSPEELVLERPSLSARVNGDLSVTLNITGNYNPQAFTGFTGFNIYIGDNNVEGDIEKRVLYISDRDFLPSIRSNPNDFLDLTVTLSNTFSYRYTSLANDTDYSEANIPSDRGRFQLKRFSPLGTYYFRVKATTLSRQSISSFTSVVKIPFVVRLENLDIASGVRIDAPELASQINSENLTGAFGNIELNDGRINFIDNDSNTTKVSYVVNGSSANIFSANGLVVDTTGNFSYSGYNYGLFYPLVESWNYAFLLTDNNLARTDDLRRDLRLYIDTLSTPNISLTLAYYEDSNASITDIERDINLD